MGNRNQMGYDSYIEMVNNKVINHYDNAITAIETLKTQVDNLLILLGDCSGAGVTSFSSDVTQYKTYLNTCKTSFVNKKSDVLSRAQRYQTLWDNEKAKDNTGSVNLTYYYYRNGSPISGSTLAGAENDTNTYTMYKIHVYPIVVRSDGSLIRDIESTKRQINGQNIAREFQGRPLTMPREVSRIFDFNATTLGTERYTFTYTLDNQTISLDNYIGW